MCNAKKAPKVYPAPATEPMHNVDASATTTANTDSRSRLQRGMGALWTRYQGTGTTDTSTSSAPKSDKLGG